MASLVLQSVSQSVSSGPVQTYSLDDAREIALNEFPHLARSCAGAGFGSAGTYSGLFDAFCVLYTAYPHTVGDAAPAMLDENAFVINARSRLITLRVEKSTCANDVAAAWLRIALALAVDRIGYNRACAVFAAYEISYLEAVLLGSSPRFARLAGLIANTLIREHRDDRIDYAIDASVNLWRTRARDAFDCKHTIEHL